MSDKNEKNALLQKEYYDFEDLSAVMRILRSEEGCPWDREQTHQSIRSALIEETYEVVEAIDHEDPILLREELGDLLFQIFFHAQIETEEERFGVSEIVSDICKKMIYRHPHVFGTVTVENSAEVLKNWETLKTKEKQRNTLVDKLRAIPSMMPSLMRAAKVSKKAGRAAECDAGELIARLEDELARIKNAIAEPATDAAYEQIGELLLCVTDFAGRLEVDAEHALYRSTNRMIDQIAENHEKNLKKT